MQFLMAIALLFDCVRQTDLSCPTKTIAASIVADDCTSSDDSHYELWQFSGKAGDTVTIDMHATAFDSYLVLLDPNDVPVAENGGDYTLSISCPANVRRRAAKH